jgi:hypothetical protein
LIRRSIGNTFVSPLRRWRAEALAALPATRLDQLSHSLESGEQTCDGPFETFDDMAGIAASHLRSNAENPLGSFKTPVDDACDGYYIRMR